MHRAEITGVVVESTYNWYWLVDGLQEAGYRVHLANTTAIKQLQTTDLAAMHLGDMPTLGLKANLAVMNTLQTEIDALEKVLAKHCRADPGFRLLKTVNGIGDALATVILLETGDINRFADVGNYASYCRCVDSKHESNGKKKGEGNTKNGNRYLAWAFVEAANFAVRYCEPARRFHQKKKAKRNGIVAIKAVAHKLSRACYHMLKTNQTFTIERCFA
jgi:transposase